MSIFTTIQKMKGAGVFLNYIDFIQFPYFRNMDINTRIDFEFPLTVFIGQNGCGKSTCLHSLYGAPKGYTPYDFWFDTKVDPVSYYNDQKKRHSFWYSYVDQGKVTREVVKARINRRGDPNYWETSRPLAWAGMATKQGDRDKPVEKDVVYLDFRAELSAFDKFFYFGNVDNSKARNKQEFIRKKSASLDNLFSGRKEFINSCSRVLNKAVTSLSEDELKWISYILGREYTGGTAVLHSLFRAKGYSVLFQTKFAKYSEAVAGSGEIAVFRLVREVLAAEDYSLILLDEPEVSLHPGAQHRLKDFLLEQIKGKKHQIILTSHSPSIAQGLPRSAIKVFYQNPSNGRFLVKGGLTPHEAFYHLEHPVENRKCITVEDVLAREILLGVLGKLGDEFKDLFNVKFNPGGESVIKKEFISVFCRVAPSNEFVMFDGDQRPPSSHFDWRSLSSVELGVTRLKTELKKQTGERIKFSVDGGSSGSVSEQQLELLKSYLDFYDNNVFYFPCKTPEEIIWNDELAKVQIESTHPIAEEATKVVLELSAIKDIKSKFAFIAKKSMGDDHAGDILSMHKLYIQRWLNLEKNADFEAMKTTIDKIRGD